MVVNLIGLVAILATVFPSTRTNLQGGVCHFAIADKCIWLALAFDIFINFGLTGIFVIALLPALRFQNRLNKITVTRCDLALAPASSTSSTPMDDLKSGTGKFVISSRADATSPERKPKKKERIKRSRLDRLFRKTIIGTCFILVPTVFNLALYTADHGDEPAWLCLTICTLDGEFSKHPCTSETPLITSRQSLARLLSLSGSPSIRSKEKTSPCLLLE